MSPLIADSVGRLMACWYGTMCEVEVPRGCKVEQRNLGVTSVTSVTFLKIPLFQAFIGVFITAVAVMLGSIQRMKFYLRTACESQEYMTALLGKIIQGLCQGNAAASARWSLISTVVVNVYKSFGHGAHFTTPISRNEHCTAGVLYVDDVDLFSMNSILVTEELWEEVVRSTASWTELLTIPGGSGKADKCFGYFIDYKWRDDGSWMYAPVTERDLNIVLPDGSVEGIALLPASTAHVTLGVSAAPDGQDTLHGEGKARRNENLSQQECDDSCGG
eukprot:scaffold49823_cov73-Cyclotella_meneghiniana.AAC.1